MPRYKIVLKPSAIRDFDRLRKYDAALVADGIERFLGDDPVHESKSRIKRLLGIQNPDYRLRLDEYRVFYNVNAALGIVEVLRVLHKSQTKEYYMEVQS